MEQRPNFLTPQDICEITKMGEYTLNNYLDSYKFNKFKLTERPVKFRKFILSIDFLNMLYTFFWYRGRIKQAERLKRHFKEYNIDVLKWEDFIC